MSSTTPDPHATALTTLTLLETRLRRIEFLLTGISDANGIPISHPRPNTPISNSSTVANQLQQLQESLNRLRKTPGPAGDLIRDIESLHFITPDLTTSPIPTTQTTLSDQTTHIFAHTSLYPETASRLSSLQSLAIPPASASASLLDLKPRIEAASARQEELEREARELRERSVRCLEWWVKIGVVENGEVWSEWEERVREVERRIGRVENVRRESSGYV